MVVKMAAKRVVPLVVHWVGLMDYNVVAVMVYWWAVRMDKMMDALKVACWDVVMVDSKGKVKAVLKADYWDV